MSSNNNNFQVYFNKTEMDILNEKVYEKIKPGIWSDNGYFHLVDSWMESDGHRKVFKFK